MKLLVHACCGPCSIMPTKLLGQAGHDLTVLYANSNIAPASEYAKRLRELRSYGQVQGFDVMEAPYDPAEWERRVAPIGESIKHFSPALGAAFAARHVGGDASGGDADKRDRSDSNEDGRPADRSDSLRESAPEALRGDAAAPVPNYSSVSELLDDERRKERCRACYRMRLEEAARTAVDGGFDALTTTLAVSPYQFTDVIREELDRAAAQAGVRAVFEDWRPYYDEATRISRELGMYRQNYCGCRYSIAEGEATRAFLKERRKAAKEARAAEHAEEDAKRAARRAEKQAYAEKRARQRAIAKALRERERADAGEQ